MNINLNEFININNLPKKGERIVVAMSGGVDSSVTAAILNYAGYEVIGVSMKLYEASKVNSPKTCCSGIDIRDAREVAKKLGIKHFIVDYKSRFKQSVIDDFIESYSRGRTPIPCIKCNQTVKFKDMLDFSKSIGCSYLATGHYVKRIEKDGRINLYQANDKSKDQSYFLFATTQNQLKNLRFPLGYFTKKEIRNLAKFFCLDVADKPDSQDICFVPNGDYASVIQKFRPDSFKKGNIKNLEGKVIGVHDGIINFTIGQRKGIKVSDKDALYVIKIDAEKNEIIVGPREKLGKKDIKLNDLNLLVNEEEFKNDIFVKVRSTGKLLKGKVNFNKDRTALVNLEEFEDGISPGQACVFYNKDKFGFKVLGGGWISKD